MATHLFEAAGACDADTFLPRVFECFTVQPLSTPDESFELRLIEVTRYNQTASPGCREQFSLLFEAVDDNKLQGGELCKLIDNESELMILFINPVAVPPQAGHPPKICFEAVFS